MDIKNIIVSIEGDYVDSYIYSGYLFLVDIDYILTVYKWENVLAELLAGMSVFELAAVRQFLLDSRKPFPNVEKNNYVVSKKNLDRFIITKYNVGVWPSDIGIFSNKLYISSENGILKLDLEYETGRLGREQLLFDEMCFAVSPNSYNRLAFAAGRDGVFVLLPHSKDYDASDVQQLIPGVCLDLDWQSTRLLANTTQGVIEAQFVEMPIRDKYKKIDDYFSALRESRSIPPSLCRKEELVAAWIAGEQVFSFNRQGSMEIKNIYDGTKEHVDYSIKDSRLLRARTAAFGTILEFESSFVALIGDKEINLSINPISWRVFPRAKNYANQLHVVKEDRIEVNIVESGCENKYGFDTEDINTND